MNYTRAAGDSSPVDVARVEALLSQRETARRARNFEEADHLRGVLSGMGVEVDDERRIWLCKPLQQSPTPAGGVSGAGWGGWGCGGYWGYAMPSFMQQQAGPQLWRGQPQPPPRVGGPQELRHGRPPTGYGPQRHGLSDQRHHPYQQAQPNPGHPLPPVGLINHQAASLLRQQLSAGGVPLGGGGGGCGARPPPPVGAPTNANKSAADLLRAQLKGSK
ncbi:MAG: hypothetical protein SGPRY_009756 [Prymnesium sp.]